MFSVTRFCVQPFEERQGRLVPGEPQQFRSEAEALSLGRLMRRRVAGVAVLEVTGWPTMDVWGRPRLLYKVGSVPSGFEAQI